MRERGICRRFLAHATGFQARSTRSRGTSQRHEFTSAGSQFVKKKLGQARGRDTPDERLLSRRRPGRNQVTYSMTTAFLESAFMPGFGPVKKPNSFDTKGNQNVVYRLRRK